MSINPIQFARRRAASTDPQRINVVTGAGSVAGWAPLSVICLFCTNIRRASTTKKAELRRDGWTIPYTSAETLNALFSYMRLSCQSLLMPGFDTSTARWQDNNNLIELVAVACHLKINISLIGLQGVAEHRLQPMDLSNILLFWSQSKLNNCKYLMDAAANAFRARMNSTSLDEKLTAWQTLKTRTPQLTIAMHTLDNDMEQLAHTAPLTLQLVEKIHRICGTRPLFWTAVYRITDGRYVELTFSEAASAGLSQRFRTIFNEKVRENWFGRA